MPDRIVQEEIPFANLAMLISYEAEGQISDEDFRKYVLSIAPDILRKYDIIKEFMQLLVGEADMERVKLEVYDDRFIRIPNPSFKEGDGSNPYIVFDVEKMEPV